jgi:Tetratricopeptide repeat
MLRFPGVGPFPEELLFSSLAIREKTLGPDHPDVATSLNNLAWLYREQGYFCTKRHAGLLVAPRAGAWIETSPCSPSPGPSQVAPRAGAWIETSPQALPAARRLNVASRAGAWIETATTPCKQPTEPCRAPCGRDHHGRSMSGCYEAVWVVRQG